MVGADGWDSLSQLFYVLNNTIQYVVLRNYELLPDSFDPSIHGDIDLLVENLNKIVYLANARKKFPENPSNVAYYVPICNDEIQFDFRFLGDNYMDKRWEMEVLQSAREFVLDSHPMGIMIMSPLHQYYTLLYHAYVQKIKIAPDYPAKLQTFATAIGATYKEDVEYSMCQLLGFMKEFDYHISIPSEWEGTLNWKNIKYSDEYRGVRVRYILHPGIWRTIRSIYAWGLKALNKVRMVLHIQIKQ